MFSRGAPRTPSRVECRCHGHGRCRRAGDYWASLHVSVTAATLKTNGPTTDSDLSPFLAAALYALSVNGPQLFCFCYCQWSEPLCSCRKPYSISDEACPHSGRDYPQVGHEYFNHVFHLVYFCCAPIQYVLERTYPNIEYAILRYKRFGARIIQPKY
jgi:hypothetical protein